MKLSYIILWVSFCLSFPGSIFPQNIEIDSIKVAIKFAKEDTNKVNDLIKFSEKLWYKFQDYEGANKYGKEAFYTAQKIGFKKGMDDALLHIGIIYHKFIFRHNTHSPLKNIDVRKVIPETAHFYLIKAYGYFLIENCSESILNNYLALKLFRKSADKLGTCEAYQILGAVYLYQDNKKEALKYTSESLILRKEIGDKLTMNDQNYLLDVKHYDRLSGDLFNYTFDYENCAGTNATGKATNPSVVKKSAGSSKKMQLMKVMTSHGNELRENLLKIRKQVVEMKRNK